MYSWKCDFQDLLTPPAPDMPKHNNFWEFIDNLNTQSELNWTEDNVNVELNAPITKNKVARVLANSK